MIPLTCALPHMILSCAPLPHMILPRTRPSILPRDRPLPPHDPPRLAHMIPSLFLPQIFSQPLERVCATTIAPDLIVCPRHRAAGSQDPRAVNGDSQGVAEYSTLQTPRRVHGDLDKAACPPAVLVCSRVFSVSKGRPTKVQASSAQLAWLEAEAPRPAVVAVLQDAVLPLRDEEQELPGENSELEQELPHPRVGASPPGGKF